jgi:dihydroorotase
VIDPRTRTDAALDILLDGDRIAAVGSRLEATAAEVLDAAGLVVAPGFIDMHVHLREPGQTHKETIVSGGRAAARGGFTSVCAMPNTFPANDNPEITARILAAARFADVRVFPIAALTRGLQGTEPTDMAALQAAGAVAFSDDGRCIQDAAVMRRAMETARSLDALVIDHCEDRPLFGQGIINEGPVSRRLCVSGIPAAAEEVIVARDIILAEALGTRVHIAHLSTKGSARLLGLAKSRGIPVTAEVTPHHLLLSEEEMERRDPDFKMNPPLRGRDDIEALIAAVRDGTIDVFATDHAPHAPAEKSVGLENAPFGIVGLETAVSLLLDRLVRPGILTLARFISMWSTRPAEILKWPAKGRIAPGADADLTLLDPDRTLVVETSRFASLSRNSPFQGWTLRGAPVMTIVAGRTVFSDLSC